MDKAQYKILVEKRLQDIIDNPDNHQHDFNDLLNCAMVDDALNMRLVEAHRGVVPQRNPGGCDVPIGPCSCGAWHE